MLILICPSMYSQAIASLLIKKANCNVYIQPKGIDMYAIFQCAENHKLKKGINEPNHKDFYNRKLREQSINNKVRSALLQNKRR